jgi:hypothetical protein
MIHAVGSSRSSDESLLLRQRVASASRRRVRAALENADVRVKAHERIHIAIAGPYAQGAPQYTYAMGPDGGRYAVGGSVNIDLRPVPGDPQATLRKAHALMQAAVGPGNPSAADMRVAAQAYRMAMQARREIEEGEGGNQAPGRLVDVRA